MQYCSLLLQTLLSPPNTFTTKHHFSFGPVTSFFLELLVIALHASPGAYWTSSDLGGSSSGVTSFWPLHTVHGVPSKEYRVVCHFLLHFADHIFSELFTMIHLSCGALYGMAHSFTELCKPFGHDKAVIHKGVVVRMYSKI